MAPSPPTGIETLNTLPLPSFRDRLFPYDSTLNYTHEGVSTPLILELQTSSSISPSQIEACFALIASTSSEDYKASSIGWSRAKKMKEMRLPDLRYMILKSRGQENGVESESVVGFLSFMLTYEDGHEVVYCYEVHLSSTLQGKGIGKRLMQMMEEVGRRSGVEKAMLTSFKANKVALMFYEKLGYEEDEYSPRARKLRNGIVKEPDYVILSKRLVAKVKKPEVKDIKPSSERNKKCKAG